MGEYNGKINVSKDSMLFVVNSIFNQRKYNKRKHIEINARYI